MTNSAITINVDNLHGLAPLYSKYATQCTPQRAYVEMDEDGSISADWSGEIGNATPMEVWHRRTLRWSVPSCVNADALKAALKSLRPKFEALRAEHSIEWDGNDYVGHLSERGQSLDYDIGRELEQLEQDEVWSAWDYVASAHIDALWPAGTALSAAVAALDASAATDGLRIDGDLAECLRQRLAQDGDGGTYADDLAATGRTDDLA